MLRGFFLPCHAATWYSKISSFTVAGNICWRSPFGSLCYLRLFLDHADVMRSYLQCQPAFQKELQGCSMGFAEGAVQHLCCYWSNIYAKTKQSEQEPCCFQCAFSGHFASHLPLDITELLLRNVGFTVCPCVCPVYILLVDRCWELSASSTEVTPRLNFKSK
jgi:hypothetical protein